MQGFRVNGTILIIFFCLGLLIALLSGLAILSYYKPGILMPVVNLFRRSKWVSKKIDEQAMKAVVSDPEKAAEMLPEREAEIFRKSMAGRSEAERVAVLEEAQTLIDKGQPQRAAEVMAARPKTASDRQAAAKKKRKARQKRKQARKQRRK